MSLRTSAWLLPQKEHMVRLDARAMIASLYSQLLIPRVYGVTRPPPRLHRSAPSPPAAIEQLDFFARLDHFVDQSVILGLLRRTCSSRDRNPAEPVRRFCRCAGEMILIRRFFSLNMYSTWRSTSLACPWAPPETWWIMMSEFGSAKPLAFGSGAQKDRAHARGHAEAVGGHVAGEETASCRKLPDPAVTEPPGELM